jgi:shikimate kinase
MRSNIVLIGMPGSGKSTVGVILAKLSRRSFVDTDVLIQVSEGKSLQGIVDGEGHMALRAIEERVLLGLRCRDHVIATGGSSVYSPAAMEHLKRDGFVVFLETPLATLESRIRNFATRGLAKRPDQGLAELFQERHPLYASYADLVVNSESLTQEEVAVEIIDRLKVPG